ncbi:hypothetical protein [Streptomyces sp. NPDC048385]|uniref:hypothetical protein n=1 Tax=Streptomyces sp. NPDC048385 TaxID=3155145 RepID=UPI00342438E8
MGGAAASDDLRLGHVTQAWLAASNDPEARVTGRYWFHQAQQQPASATLDEAFQEELVDALARYTGVTLP